MEISSKGPVNEHSYQMVLDRLSQWEKRMNRLEKFIPIIQVHSDR